MLLSACVPADVGLAHTCDTPFIKFVVLCIACTLTRSTIDISHGTHTRYTLAFSDYFRPIATTFSVPHVCEGR